MLEARDLGCRRGDRLVFAGVDAVVPPGGALLLVGPNGAGKSSLLRVIAGLLAPASGEVFWRGVDVRSDAFAHAKRLHYVGHQDALKPALSTAENLVAFAGGDAGAALAAMGLGPVAGLPARVLSAGQRRRLALARLALAPRALWLLDEPTLGLDAASVERFGVMLARHRAAGGCVVAATHLPLPLPDARTLHL